MLVLNVLVGYQPLPAFRKTLAFELCILSEDVAFVPSGPQSCRWCT